MHARPVSQVHALNRLKGMDPDFPARPDPWPSPSERVWAEFLAVLDALPPSARVAFMLYDVFGADYEDISRVLGLPLHAWERFGVWLVIGIALYFSYGYRRSKLRRRSAGA